MHFPPGTHTIRHVNWGDKVRARSEHPVERMRSLPSDVYTMMERTTFPSFHLQQLSKVGSSSVILLSGCKLPGSDNSGDT